MPGTLTLMEKLLLAEIQEDFPLDPRPYRVIAGRCGCTEDEAIRAVRRLSARGLVREISALLDGRRLGYRSTLAALRVPGGRVDRVAERINRHPGVSHNYLRDHRYNLWFTLSVPGEADLPWTVESLAGSGAEEALLLPALRAFKLRVRLPVRPGKHRPDEAATGTLADGRRADPLPPREAATLLPHPGARTPPFFLSSFDRALLARLENPLPVGPRPWDTVATGLGVSLQELFEAVAGLSQRGVIRRIAAVPRHRRLGYTANGMACFLVPDAEIEAAGRAAASVPEVSHCYQRETHSQWPYPLYAMVHARTREECDALVARLCRRIGCRDHQLLYSLREFRNQRVNYFSDITGTGA
jgi:DNA-binding Lrp family transcriptional regulator